MITPSKKIIQALGGRKIASVVLQTPPTTIQGWEEAGWIPAKRQAEVYAKCRALGLNITARDFIAGATK